MLIEKRSNESEQHPHSDTLAYFERCGWDVDYSALTMDLEQCPRKNVTIHSACDLYPDDGELHVSYGAYMPYPFSTEACQFLHHLSATLKYIGKFDFDYSHPTFFSIEWKVACADMFAARKKKVLIKTAEEHLMNGYDFVLSCVNSLTQYSRVSIKRKPLPKKLIPSTQTAFCLLQFTHEVRVH